MSQSNEPVGQAAPSASESAPQSSERPLEHRGSRVHAWRVHTEETLERDAEKALGALRKRPSVGVLLLGGLAVAAADAIGVGEVALGLAVGYAVYQYLHKKDESRAA
jgi:hypothetical protein